MQWFREGYRGICHASLVFFVYTGAFSNLLYRMWQVKIAMLQNVRDYTF